MNWISNWRKFEIKNDTIYHLFFGELADSTKAKIKYLRNDSFELYYPKDDITYTFKKINTKIEENSTVEEFWNGFYKRRLEFKCIPEREKTTSK